jgi:succinoglycan biosynthesis protein ExoL
MSQAVDQAGFPAAARIEVFGFDVAEVSQIRRIRTMIALGHDVHSFTMRRQNMNVDFQPDWPNTHLSMTENENLLRRVAVIASSILKMAGHRARIRQADMIVARNLDMLAIAHVARAIAGATQVPLVYECLDIHGSLCGDNTKGRAMRAAERYLLNRCQMLVVSSPGFIREYFELKQNYRGPWALLENKLAAGTALPARPTTRPARSDGAPLRIGWVGTIRCAPSLALLAAVADHYGDKVQIVIHGVVHHHALPDFNATLAARPNMIAHGGYDYPQDLPRIYGDCDVVWSQDLWQRGNNSDWLLPNRIYEASWAGCPSLAVATTETGRRVADDRLGWVVDQPELDRLIALIDGLTPEIAAARGMALLGRPALDFVHSVSEMQSVIDRVLQQNTEDAGPARRVRQRRQSG